MMSGALVSGLKSKAVAQVALCATENDTAPLFSWPFLGAPSPSQGLYLLQVLGYQLTVVVAVTKSCVGSSDPFEV